MFRCHDPFPMFALNPAAELTVNQNSGSLPCLHLLVPEGTTLLHLNMLCWPNHYTKNMYTLKKEGGDVVRHLTKKLKIF